MAPTPASGTIASAGGEPFRPALPRLDVVGDVAVFTDVRGRRWSVADARKGEAPRIYRVPRDPDATHRVFRRDDGQRAEPDREAVLGMRDDFVSGAPAMRVVVLLDVGLRRPTERRVVQLGRGWEASLPDGLATFVWAVAQATQ